MSVTQLESTSTDITHTSIIPGVKDTAESIDIISEIAATYGFEILLISLFIVIFVAIVILLLYNNFRMMNRLLKNQSSFDDIKQEIIDKIVIDTLSSTKPDNEIVDQLEGVVHIMEDVVEEFHHHNEEDEEDYHKNILGAYIDVNMAFKNASKEAFNALKCERIAIYVFHNGNTSLHGLPFFKMSCIHEWDRSGHNTLRGKSHSDVPLHYFNEFIEVLWNKGVYKAEDLDKTKEKDPSINEFCLFSKAKALYMTAIKDSNGIMTGFVVTEFSEVDTFEHDIYRDNEVKTIINEMIQKIAPIVSTKYIMKK